MNSPQSRETAALEKSPSVHAYRLNWVAEEPLESFSRCRSVIRRRGHTDSGARVVGISPFGLLIIISDDDTRRRFVKVNSQPH